MRTTVSLNDELLKAAKARARESGVTLGSLLDSALRRELALRAPAPGSVPELPVFRGRGGLRPGVDGASNRSLQEALDRDRGVTDLR